MESLTMQVRLLDGTIEQRNATIRRIACGRVVFREPELQAGEKVQWRTGDRVPLIIQTQQKD